MAWLTEGLPGTGVSADVGAGTGLSTVPLAEALGEGWRVIAIEPNRAMRDAGASHPRITWRDGTGESTGLGDASCDLVVCAQAFHWLDQARSVAEFRRVLRDSGRVALVWNTHKTDLPEMGAYKQIMMRHATEPPSSPSCSGWKASNIDALRDSDLFGDVASRTFTHEQRLTLNGLVDRALSSSYMPSHEKEQATVREDLSSYFELFASDGLVTLTYDCVVHRAEVILR
jgi:SAM-dependent methyltransferase